MAQIQLSSDLKALPKVISLDGFFISRTNRILVKVTDNGLPFTPDAGVTAFIIQDNNNTITVVGGTTNGMVYVDLPQEVYDVPGSIQIAVRIGNTTVACCKGYIPFTI